MHLVRSCSPYLQFQTVEEYLQTPQQDSHRYETLERQQGRVALKSGPLHAQNGQ